jgi:16S rRNA (uracil1498-N3)-methyltransferase
VNLLLAHASELRSSDGETEIVVEGERALHLHKVLRAQVGACLRVGVERDSIGTAEVLEAGEARVVLGKLLMQPMGAAPPVRLVVALPRPKALRRLLQTAACLGVDHIDLVNAWRVEKSYWSSPEIEVATMKEQLWLGCEQGRHVWVPSIACHRFLMPFLAGLSDQSGLRLLAHPGGQRWLSAKDAQASPCTLAFGPEGGWIEDELASFADAGFERFTLSESILRSEIAIAAALAQLELLTARE